MPTNCIDSIESNLGWLDCQGAFGFNLTVELMCHVYTERHIRPTVKYQVNWSVCVAWWLRSTITSTFDCQCRLSLELRQRSIYSFRCSCCCFPWGFHRGSMVIWWGYWLIPVIEGVLIAITIAIVILRVYTNKVWHHSPYIIRAPPHGP